MASILLRINKGSPLTNNELDDNFRQLNLNKIELGGDLGGTTSLPVVTSLRGNAVSSATPTTGQTLTWSGVSWTPVTPTGTSGNIVTVLSDISNFFNNVDQIFTLKDDGTAITEGVNYTDNKDFTVSIGGRNYGAAVPQTATLGPWIIDYTAERTYTYKVTGSRIIFYRGIENRQTAEIRINNRSSIRQTRRRYPFSANSIVLGD
jgi:hypothetical protein